MSLKRIVPCLLIFITSLCCRPAPEQVLSGDERSVLADEVGRLFNQIPEATNALDFERLLSYYRESDDLTYVALGRVTRSFAAFSDVMDAQFGGVAEANLQWLDTTIDVLSRDVAVATAKFEFTAGLEGGGTAQSAGTYTVVYVLRGGQWGIEYSAHTFPAGGR
jgi:ketosteroid isomerase-like protein